VVVGTTCIGTFIGQLDGSIVQLTLPTLEHEFAARLDAVSWVAIADHGGRLLCVVCRALAENPWFAVPREAASPLLALSPAGDLMATVLFRSPTCCDRSLPCDRRHWSC
jgi:hypothetical protein